MTLTPTEFAQHRKVIYLNDPDYGIEGFIAIHRSNNGFPSFGATRIFPYSSLNEALNDALRLSRLMTYKSLMSGLTYGGAKAVLLKKNSGVENEKFLKRYAWHISKLNGEFITGADIGVSPHDVKYLKSQCPYFVGVSVDPVKYTVKGIVLAMQTACHEVFGTQKFSGRTIAIQGLGKIGSELVKQLNGKVKKIIACDVDKKTISRISEKYPNLEIVDPDEIYNQNVDIFSPCAIFGTLNSHTIPKLKCRVVVGGANNQLGNPEDAQMLYNRGILYAPDFVTNAGGLISVVDEYDHSTTSSKRIMNKINHIPSILEKIFCDSKLLQLPTNKVAEQIALHSLTTSFGS